MDKIVAEEETPGKDFIRKIIDRDVKTAKNGGKVVTRFPPEPNGYLHIGHAKSICLNFGLANEHNSVCHLRFDDTDPTKEDAIYEESIKETIHWLGFDWQGKLFHASDYFEQFYQFALQLIQKGKAYVCDLNEEEIRTYRGTVKTPGNRSTHCEKSIEEHLDLFKRMRKGEFKDGAYVLRAKIDMASSNMKMRDPLLYRIRHAHHYKTGDAWCIYPMYDFAHPLSDAIEGITHSICTLEFENNRELYDWFLDHIEANFPSHPHQYEFARLDLENAVMSKRKILQLVEKGVVDGWDDPRLHTLAGLRRRGCTPEAIRQFCEMVGISRANSTVEQGQLDFCLRNDLNAKAPRIMAVLRPLKVIIDNYDEEIEWLDASYWPHDIPKTGSRKVPFTKEIYIEEEDFMENPSKDFFRLTIGSEVRLRYAYCITCTHVDRDEKSGKIIAIHCTYDKATKSGNNPVGRKVKGTIHWVSSNSLKTTINLFNPLLQQVDKEEDFLSNINPHSKETLTESRIEISMQEAKPGERYQFERQGYFFVDPYAEKIVFNRIVTLKDSFKKKA